MPDHTAKWKRQWIALRRNGSGVAPKRSAGGASAVRSQPSMLVLFQDLIASLKAPGFWLYGAWIDTSLQYRSQALGAFWMVGGTLVFVVLIGTLYSHVLKDGSDLYYAHIATGYVFWLFIQQSLAQSTRLFSKARSMIQNGYVRYADYVLRMVGGLLINFAYNLIIVAGAVLLTPVHFGWPDLVLLLTIPLMLLAVLGMCFLLSVIGARYADAGELVQTLLRLAFFITPIIWVPSATSGKGAMIGPFLFANPFYYLIEIIREPLVYGRVPWLEIGVVAVAIPVIWFAAAVAYARAKPYVPLWI